MVDFIEQGLRAYSRDLRSERTKAALKAAKERGVKLGNPNLKTGGNPVAARQAKQAKAKKRNRVFLLLIKQKIPNYKNLNLQEIADQLNEAGYKTARGCEWRPMSVSRVLCGDADENYRHLQTRVAAKDARRFINAAEDNGHGRSVQTLLVEAMNKLMVEWGEAPIIDFGSAGRSK